MISSPRCLLVPVALFGSAFALNACSGDVSVGDKTIDRDQLELESSRTLTQQYNEKPKSIDCPEDLKAEVDVTETCELVDQRGNHYDMKLTVTSVDDDGNAKFNIQVGQIKQMGAVPE
jgi:hypothetical protein